jgi:hypothetical protein
LDVLKGSGEKGLGGLTLTGYWKKMCCTMYSYFFSQ